jgi:hypothetical protein
MKQQAPSLAPGFAIDTYLVLDQIGSSAVYRETDEIAADRLVVIRDISQGQYSHPLRVVAFNTVEGWSRDVTEEIARELVDMAVRGGEPLTRSARSFVERVTHEEMTDVIMTIWGGENYVSEMNVEVKVVAPGVGEIVCPECHGDPEGYPTLFPNELGITQCVDCKRTGRIFVAI